MTKMCLLAGAAVTLATAATAGPMTVLPGEWEVTSTTQMQSMPDVPPQVAAMLRQQQGKPVVLHTCVTPEQAASGPQAGPPDSGCKFKTLSYDSGRMAAESTCKRGNDVMTMKMAGTYTPTSYDMTGQMAGSHGGTGALAMTTHIIGRRVGPVCSAKAK